MMGNTTYWERIRKNIKTLKEEGQIKKRYKYQSFCDNFIPSQHPLITPIKKECLCNHQITYNYKYEHKDNGDYFILGSCCIKKFSTYYKKQRECKECKEPIRKNEDNLCKDCRYEKEEKRLIKKYEEKCKCVKCKVIKKDDKYKLCYTCKFGETKKEIYSECINCGIEKAENTYIRCYACNIINKYA